MNPKEINLMSGDMADAVLMSNDPNSMAGNIQIHVGGRKYKTLYTKKFTERKMWVKPNPNEILSILPGSVDSIMVKVGDKVKKGDRLMIYEAMKMKNVISAPFEAVIETIDVEVGDKLPKGARLILLRN
ncbi:MAG: acetyl-CoA carboxylase biotin carboxyl carrier protein subunit [Bacteroidales bacterium]